MTPLLTLEILTPEKLLMKGQVTLVTAPAYEGEVGIMANHTPALMQLKPGKLTAFLENNSVQNFDIQGGLLNVMQDNRCVILLGA